MENASKAILIAGGVLLGVLILAFLIFFWNNMSNFQAGTTSGEKESQLAQFNMEFETYSRGLDERNNAVTLYGSDIITIVNKVQSYDREPPEDLFNAKVQYEHINVIVDLSGASTSTSLTNLDIFKQNVGGVKVESGHTLIKDVANNKVFMGNDGVLKRYLDYESKYGKNFISKLSANYQRLLDLMAGSDKNDPTDYDFVGAVQKVTGRKLTSADGELYASGDVSDNKGPMKIIKGYSDYTRFKTAKFKCNGTNYNKNGQINYMEFEFVGMT